MPLFYEVCAGASVLPQLWQVCAYPHALQAVYFFAGVTLAAGAAVAGTETGVKVELPPELCFDSWNLRIRSWFAWT